MAGGLHVIVFLLLGLGDAVYTTTIDNPAVLYNGGMHEESDINPTPNTSGSPSTISDSPPPPFDTITLTNSIPSTRSTLPTPGTPPTNSNPTTPSTPPTTTKTPTTTTTATPTPLASNTTTSTPTSVAKHSHLSSTSENAAVMPSKVIVTLAKVEVGVMMVVMVAVVVLLLPQMRRRVSTPSYTVSWHRQSSDQISLRRNSLHVSINSLYEPFAGRPNAASRRE